ncbi:hypothetical protein SAMN05421767_10763 [Granulicatella balaenopterae]|uniref:Uncharacterized protein n=1 Tax=Granulicatella balaenopterae TaxID=137733 RepID=A0A1H9J2W8_9LACT|nr:hypothetical protein [Granulicatella balaenopterae]SEQ81122.1 hypothetical protein SAMN05421767_10763 [Granulicatella balaenopterae]
MKFFNFSKKNRKAVPSWASFFNETEYETFIDELNKHFKNQKFNINEENSELKLNDEETVYCLWNIAKKCDQVEMEEWPNIMKEHLDFSIGSETDYEYFCENMTDFDFVKEFIGVTLYRIEDLEKLGLENVIYEPYVEGFYKVLIFDFPITMQTVLRGQLEAWDKSVDELMALGLDNLRSRYEKRALKKDLGGITLWSITDDEGYANNILLEPEELKEYVGSNGALVAFPNVLETLIYPITDAHILIAANKMIPIIHDKAKYMNPMSEGLYYYDDGEMFAIPYTYENHKLQIHPTEELNGALNNLTHKHITK